MADYSTVQERDAFDERIFEIVQEYLEEESSSLKNGRVENSVGMSVNPQTLELALNNKENNPVGWDFYPIEALIRPTENNNSSEPDCDSTHELASSYCFVK